ncbi:hypothetical protein OG21DRAFT_578403 [Imleria badia]|nr:hypothetical protein OG21DRAFT_578403 [Imleria badia]
MVFDKFDPAIWIPAQRLLEMSKWVGQGAEARVFKTYIRFRSSHDNWGPLEADIKAGCPSTPVMDDILFKHRFSKRYRHPTLDAMLTRQRLIGEARTLMRCLRAGVNVPGIRLVDVSEGCLGLEFIEGPVVRYLIPAGTDEPRYRLIFHEENDGEELDYEEIPDNISTRAAEWGCASDITMETLMEKIGVEIAKLHLIDVIHGDLTTSNMLLRSSNNDLVLIDFGLAYQSTLVEDKAVDLYVLERAFTSTHPDSEPLFASILAAYANRIGKDWDQIKKRLDEGKILHLGLNG